MRNASLCYRPILIPPQFTWIFDYDSPVVRELRMRGAFVERAYSANNRWAGGIEDARGVRGKGVLVRTTGGRELRMRGAFVERAYVCGQQVGGSCCMRGSFVEGAYLCEQQVGGN